MVNNLIKLVLSSLISLVPGRLNQDSFSRFGAKLWNAIPNEFRQLSKGAFEKKKIHDFLLSIFEVEDDYVEVPILLQTKANSASSSQWTNH